MSEIIKNFVLTRRRVLAVGAGALSIAVVRPARATTETMQTAIKQFSGGAAISQGKVTLDIPPLVENGNSVPLVVTVDNPMTDTNFVQTIAIFNERNPESNIGNFHLSPRSGRAWISTRIRLGDSQMIVAVAKLNDGSFWSGSAELIVTLPACAEN